MVNGDRVRSQTAHKRPLPAVKLRPGDIIMRGSIAYGFELVDAITREILQERIRSVKAAVDEARRRSRGDLWQQHTNSSGQAISEPFRLGPLTDDTPRDSNGLSAVSSATPATAELP